MKQPTYISLFHSGILECILNPLVLGILSGGRAETDLIAGHGLYMGHGEMHFSLRSSMLKRRSLLSWTVQSPHMSLYGGPTMKNTHKLCDILSKISEVFRHLLPSLAAIFLCFGQSGTLIKGCILLIMRLLYIVQMRTHNKI